MGIKKRGLAADVISFSSAMSACDRAGEWQVGMDAAAEPKCYPKLLSGAGLMAALRFVRRHDMVLHCQGIQIFPLAGMLF